VGEDFGWMDVWVLNPEWFGREGRSPCDGGRVEGSHFTITR
jgi:hypothetical protein